MHPTRYELGQVNIQLIYSNSVVSKRSLSLGDSISFRTSTLFSYFAGWLKGEALVIIGAGSFIVRMAPCIRRKSQSIALPYPFTTDEG